MAKPRSPLPPWPEIPLQRWDFDAAYWASLGEAESPAAGFGDFAESWSGFALQRDGLSVSPIVMPGVDANGHTNIAAQGTIRFWFSPSWSSADMGGKGPGHYARLIELVTANGTSSAVAWSLYASPDGSTLFLSGQGGQGVADILEAKISFEAGRWYLLALNYSAKATALYVNAEKVAEGTGLAAVNPASAGLVVGSDGAGGDLAGGLFEEVTTFGKPETPEDQALYYHGVSGQVARGPISAEEEAAGLEAAAQRRAEREAAALMNFAWSEPANPCVTNGPVYLTNIGCVNLEGLGWTVMFTIAGGTNGIPYDIYSTTNLVGSNITHSQWAWLDQGYTCNIYTFTNQPATNAFYVLGMTNDTDHDGLSDAYEWLVSKTLVTTNDTDGDLIPDAWEVANGLNPLVNDASEDFDGDDVSNFQEYNYGTNSTKPNDQWLVAWGNYSRGQCTVPAGIRDLIALDGGLEHTVALRSNETVVAWGGDSSGQTNVPGGLSNVVSIAASWNQSVALRANGTVTNWGETYGTMPSDLTNAVAVTVGWRHVAALRSNGTVSVWGDSRDAGSTNLAGLSSVKAIAAGWEHNVALLSNGTVDVWGLTVKNITNVPTGLSNVIAVAAGGHHTLVLRTDGTVVAWGAGQTNGGFFWDQGQSLVPSGLSNVAAIAAGGYSSMALRANGSVVTWGEVATTPSGNGFRVIGAGDGHCMAVRSGRQTPVVIVPPTNQVVGIGAPVTFTVLAAAPASFSYQWQFNGTNIAGATNATFSLASVQSTNLGFYRVVISNGAGTTYSPEARLSFLPPPAILSRTQPAEQWLLYGDTLNLSIEATTPGFPTNVLGYQWTLNDNWLWAPDGTSFSGQLISFASILHSYATSYEGVYSVVITNAGGSTNVSWTIHVAGEGSPIWWGGTTTQAWDTVWDVHDTLALACGGNHRLLLHENGTMLAWGANDYGQTDVPLDLMEAPMNEGIVTAIAAGDAHSLALKSNATVVAWGRNDFSQTNAPANLTNVIALAAGGRQSLALKREGTVVQWGQTNAPVPTSLTNVIAIASGTNFHLALRQNSTVVAWGANNHGQTNVPAGLTNVVAIAAGGAHALALRENGTVIAWGANGSAQTNVPATLTNAMGVAAGYAHSAALRNDGTVLTWGDNTYGQTNTPNLIPVKLLSAGGNQTLAGIFSPLVQYPVDVTKDLLLIYNTASTNSILIKDYYLAHRPMVSGANTLGISTSTGEIISYANFTNQVRAAYLDWLNQHPTERPQYIILFPDLPTRVWGDATDYHTISNSVAFGLYTASPGIAPFITSINMGLEVAYYQDYTNDCIAYINKLASFGSNYAAGKLFISASARGYGNTNFVLDNLRHGPGFPYPEGDFSDQGWRLSSATNVILGSGTSGLSVTYNDRIETNGQPAQMHITAV